MTSPVIDADDGLALTVPALLARRVATDPEHTFLVCDDDRLSYTEAERRSAVLARGLLAAGLGAGSRVALLHPNGVDFVVSWLAAARIGAVSVPLSTFSTSAELVGLLRGVDATALLAATSYRSHHYPTSLGAGIAELDLGAAGPLWSPAVPSLRRVAFADADADAHPDRTVTGLLAGAADVAPRVLAAAEAQVSPADPMVIVHTSGSTSEPKGVIHTHGALIRHLDNLNQLRRYDATEILFANSPFFWIGGFGYALLGTLVAGATLVCANAGSAAGVLDVLERERPTMVNGFAATIAHLPDDPSFAARDLSSIRRGNLYPIMPAAVRPSDPELHHSMLGMTEAGSVCLASDDESEQPEQRRGSFGRPVPGFEISVLAPEESSGPGELCFRGPFLMEGYDGRERHETFDVDGWYRTGDLVTVDADGFVYFRGRSSEMIKTSGANVSPREVEAAIAEVAGLGAHVVGIDDDARGQLVAALVRVGPDDAVDVAELRTQLRGRLSAYKVPRQIVLVAEDEVPMMSSGKLDLRAVRELLRGA
jgi:acyl-CoA synthetase (AMP-forming)/AMP-acid ligase II